MRCWSAEGVKERVLYLSQSVCGAPWPPAVATQAAAQKSATKTDRVGTPIKLYPLALEGQKRCRLRRERPHGTFKSPRQCSRARICHGSGHRPGRQSADRPLEDEHGEVEI